jgi:hypothetical protein
VAFGTIANYAWILSYGIATAVLARTGSQSRPAIGRRRDSLDGDRSGITMARELRQELLFANSGQLRIMFAAESILIGADAVRLNNKCLQIAACRDPGIISLQVSNRRFIAQKESRIVRSWPVQV